MTSSSSSGSEKPNSLPDLEELEEEDVGMYLEQNTYCFQCRHVKNTNIVLEEKLRALQKLLATRDHHFHYLERANAMLERHSEGQERIVKEVRAKWDQLFRDLNETQAKYEKALREIQQLQVELERKSERPPAPPAPPPPPPPSLFRFLSWKLEKCRKSTSMSRIDDICGARPMVLNDDILDAIRNRRYSLKHVEDDGQDKRDSLTTNGTAGNMIARILERRVRMEYSDDSDDNTNHTF